MSLARPIVIGTLVAGTLDILAAVTMTLIHGRDPMAMLRYVASGPFPGAPDWGTAGSALGLAVHFALMAIMVAIFVLPPRASRRSGGRRSCGAHFTASPPTSR